MYFVQYSNNKYEAALPGLNVWKVKWIKGSSYKIIKIIIGGKRRPDIKTVSINGNRNIFRTEREVIKLILSLGIYYHE